MKLKNILLAASTTALFASSIALANPAYAQKRVNNTRGSTKNLDIPTCDKPIGTIAVVNGTDYQGWRTYRLRRPERLLKMFVQRSGCFDLVNRGSGLQATQREQRLSEGGDLQRRSNVGGGQIKAADYTMIADIITTDNNAGGSGIASGIAGRAFGRRIGGVVGGFKSKRVEAQTLLEVMNTRTTEGVAFAEGSASKKDLKFGGFGFGGFAGAVGGGYEDTEVGKVVTYAFLDAYRQIVYELGGIDQEKVAEAAPTETFKVRKTVSLRRSPSESSSIVRELDRGLLVYPLGGKEGLWWEVEDENGNVGWVPNDKLKPAK